MSNFNTVSFFSPNEEKSIPLSARQKILAAQLLQQQAADPSTPIYSPAAGLAKVAAGALGGFMEHQAIAKEEAAQQASAQQRAQLLAQLLYPGAGAATGGAAGAPSPGAPVTFGATPPASASASGTNPAGYDPKATEAMIRQSAASHGIDPDVAVAVARSEGLNKYQGDNGSSFGPFQLHYGGVAPGGNKVAGLGDDFTAATKLDARDPSTVPQQIDFALANAAKNGWGAFHGAANMDQRAGISRQPGGTAAADLPAPGAQPTAGTGLPAGVTPTDVQAPAAAQPSASAPEPSLRDTITAAMAQQGGAPSAADVPAPGASSAAGGAPAPSPGPSGSADGSLRDAIIASMQGSTGNPTPSPYGDLSGAGALPPTPINTDPGTATAPAMPSGGMANPPGALDAGTPMGQAQADGQPGFTGLPNSGLGMGRTLVSDPGTAPQISAPNPDTSDAGATLGGSTPGSPAPAPSSSAPPSPSLPTPDATSYAPSSGAAAAPASVAIGNAAPLGGGPSPSPSPSRSAALAAALAPDGYGKAAEPGAAEPFAAAGMGGNASALASALQNWQPSPSASGASGTALANALSNYQPPQPGGGWSPQQLLAGLGFGSSTSPAASAPPAGANSHPAPTAGGPGAGSAPTPASQPSTNDLFYRVASDPRTPPEFLNTIASLSTPQIKFETLPNGMVVRENARTGEVTPVYQGQQANKFGSTPNGVIFNETTGAVPGGQTGFRFLTPAEKQSLGFPVDQPVQVGPDGKVVQGGGTTVNVGQEQNTYDQAMAKQLAENQIGLMSNIENNRSKLRDLNAMGAAVSRIQQNGGTTGMGQDEVKGLQSAVNAGANALGLGQVFDVSDKEVLGKLGRQLAGMSAKDVGGARTTNFLMEQMLKANPGLEMSPTGNQRMIGIGQQVVQRNIDIGQAMQDAAAAAVQQGKRVNPQEMEKIRADYDATHHITDPVTGQDLSANPKLPEFQGGGAGGAPAPGNGSAAAASAAPQGSPPATPPQPPVVLRSKADFDAAPSGTVFIGPDGVRRRKP